MPRKVNKKNASSRGDKGTSKSKEEDPLALRKAKLRKQIEDLRSVVLEVETNLDISRFKDVTTDSAAENAEESTAKVNRLRNMEAALEIELHRLAGFSCAAFEKDHCTFNLSPCGNYDRENEYAVQILLKDEVGSLGKWVMPMSVDMKELATRIPLNQLKSVPTFLKACKHLVDCHFARQCQYRELMEAVSTLKHCSLQTNFGYTRIIMELHGVHDLQEDAYKDIIVYLMYNPGEARPHSVKVDVKGKKQLDEEAAKILKSSLKCFKYSDLSSAFKKILNSDRKRFQWDRVKDEDSPINLNNRSSSDEEDEEGYLDASRRSKRRRKKKTPDREKKGKRGREADSPGTQSRSVEGTISNETVKVPTQQTPSRKKKGMLRQTKLSFHADNAESSSQSNIESQGNEPKRATKPPELLTSTPLPRSKGEPILSTSFDLGHSPVGGSKRKPPSRTSQKKTKTTALGVRKMLQGQRQGRRKKG